MNTKIHLLLGFALLIIVLGGCTALPAGSIVEAAELNASDRAADQTIEFEVAEDATRFVFDAAPVFEEDGYPAYGNAFITQGYIYPAGTITCGEEGCNGVNPDGSPEFPEAVLGEWTCRGYFVGDGAHTTSGPMVISTQVYSFGDGYGEQMLISEGYELMDRTFQRVITGGTGNLNGIRGALAQTFTGFTANMGVTLRFSLDVQGKPISLSDLTE